MKTLIRLIAPSLILLVANLSSAQVEKLATADAAQGVVGPSRLDRSPFPEKPNLAHTYHRYREAAGAQMLVYGPDWKGD